MPEIGFITTVPPLCRTWTSGEAPTRILSPVCTRKVQYAPRSSSSSRRKSERASSGVQRPSAAPPGASSRPLKSRRITKFAPSPRPISSRITRRTMSAYRVSSMSNDPSESDTGRRGSSVSRSASGKAYCSSTESACSGVPSSCASKPRSRICRYGTRASRSWRGPAAGTPARTGRSARVSYEPTVPSSTSTVSRARRGARRCSRAKAGAPGAVRRSSRAARLVTGSGFLPEELAGTGAVHSSGEGHRRSI